MGGTRLVGGDANGERNVRGEDETHAFNLRPSRVADGTPPIPASSNVAFRGEVTACNRVSFTNMLKMILNILQSLENEMLVPPVASYGARRTLIALRLNVIETRILYIVYIV